MQKLLYFIVHFLFWTTFIALSWMSIKANPEEIAFMVNRPWAPFMLLGWGALNFYTFYFYFQPRFLDTRKYTLYLLVAVAFSVILSSIFVGAFWLVYPEFRPYALQKLFESMVGSFLISQCGSLLRGFISWNQNLQNRTALENQSLRNELAMLKAQLSPHFLFNTLNNIDSLIYQSRDEASATLIKLAALLRYMLYESDGKEVPLEKEIQYLEQLTELQRLRFEQSNYVEFKVEKETNEATIAPLLFLPFIENAFKFVSQPASMPAIKIDLTATENWVRLQCQNYFNPNAKKSLDKGHGIGLANARRRLELLYPNMFDLQVSPEGNMFKVDLSIQLK